jgi:hypothetical protein
MFKFLIALLLASGLSTGCTTWVDARGPSELCEVHHSAMRVEKFQGVGKTVAPTQQYIAARRKFFFHSYPFTLPRKWGRTYVIYICDDCVAAEKVWLKQHPQQ